MEAPALSVAEVASRPMKGFDGLGYLEGSNFRDCSTVVVIPTRGLANEPSLRPSWVANFQELASPMNHRRVVLFATGFAVDAAYNECIAGILRHPIFSKWKYVLTVEDDNFPDPDAHLRLLESIERTGFDAVSGLYFTKGEVGLPLALGSAEEFRRTGILDLRAVDVREAVEKRAVLEVNAIPMGFALWRMDLFRQIAAPWFVTCAEFVDDLDRPEDVMLRFSQDTDFCVRARIKGRRFGIDTRVKVGHKDYESGEMF